MKSRAAWLMAALLAAASVAQGGPVQPQNQPQNQPHRQPLSAEAAATLRQINAYRAAGANCGGVAMPPVPALHWDDALQRAADAQARHMARVVDATHTGGDGSSVGQRITAQGYGWRAVGENVAAGQDSALATLAQWMASPGHCRNMMGPHFRDVAVARRDRPGTAYNHYWVMVLGARMR